MAEEFPREFSRWARRVRRRWTLRRMLAAAAAGPIAAAPIALAGWAMHLPSLPHLAAAFAALGLPVGVWLAHRRRWTDAEVALFLDARLQGDEAVTTAVALSNDPTTPPPAAFDAVLASAMRVLRNGASNAVALRIARRWQLLAIPALAVIAFAWTNTRATVAASPPGTTLLQIERVPGLEVVERLREVPARDAEQRAHFDRIADEARALRDRLHDGVPRREALDQIARLRDHLAEEQSPLAGEEQRRGLEAATDALSTRGLHDAASALGDRDLARLDQAMAREGNAPDAAQRARAREALQAAAEAASREGASEVSRALREQLARLDARAARAEALRRMAEQLGADAATRAALERFDRERSDTAANDLARAMAQAVNRMSAAERQNLAERLRAAATSAPPAGAPSNATPSATAARAMLQQLANGIDPRTQTPTSGQQGAQSSQPAGAQGAQAGQPTGSQAGQPSAQSGSGLTPAGQMGALGPLANPPGAPGGAGAASGLTAAEQGARSAEGQIAGTNSPGASSGMPGAGSPTGAGGNTPGGMSPGNASAGQSGSGTRSGTGTGTGERGHPGDSQGRGGQGGTGEGGGGDHGGGAGPVRGGATSTEQAGGTPRGAGALPAGAAGTTTSAGGGTANARGTGELHSVAPEEIRGVESSQVPAEYREQVRQYFQP